MPLTEEFRRHLHELMVETSLGLRDELNNYQRETIAKARATHNSAAIPVAYSNAAIHSFRVRTEAILNRYLEALQSCDIPVDDAVEKEMLRSIQPLTSARAPLSLPPGVKGPQIAAIQRSHKMELDRVGSLLYREAANRLREAKMRLREEPSLPTQAGHTSMAQPREKIVPDSPGAPTAFISYSWDSTEHKAWVLQLAQRLRTAGGIAIILDQWDLQLGSDRTRFMESSIRESDFVLLICTPTYAAKGNARTGGAGYQAMIITGQLALQITQNKFIPVLRQGEWDDSAVPIWLQSKVGVDLRGDPYDETQYDLLLRAIHQAQAKAPPVGPKPVFQDNGLIGNAVTVLLQPALESSATSAELRSSPDPKVPQRSPAAYAFYEKKGTAERVQVFVRPAAAPSPMYTFETSEGIHEEDTQSRIEERYLLFDRDLKRRGFTRMQSFSGTSGQHFYLP